MKKQDRSVLSQLEVRVADAQAMIETQNKRLSELGRERDGAIRAGAADEELDQIGDAIQIANRTIDREAAKISVLAVQIDEERKRLSDEEQRQREKVANVAADRAASDMKKLFDLLRENIRAVMRAAAEADILVEEANKFRRAGLPLASVESRCRSMGAKAAKVVSEERVRLWVFASTGSVLSDANQERVKSRDNIHGVLPSDATGVALGGNPSVVRREFVRRTVQLGERGGEPDALASVLSVPGLTHSETPIWEPILHPSPEAILAALQALEAVRSSGAVKTELIPIEKVTDEVGA